MNWHDNSDILLAHTGHPHRQNNQVNQPPETTSDAAEINRSAPEVIPASQSIPETKPLEAEVNSATEQVQVTNSPLPTVSLFPGFGESILALLLAAPFVLQAIRRWLHQ